MRKLYFFAFALFFLVFFLILKSHYERNDSNTYFKNLNLVLTGIVKDKQVVSNGSGLLYVDVIKSTIPEYDIRESGGNYYCAIHKEKAEIIEGGLLEIHVGDSIVINSRNLSFECFRDGKLIKKKTLYLHHNIFVTSAVRKIHRL